MPALRRPSEPAYPASSSSLHVGPSSMASTASTIKATRGVSPEPPERPRSSSFSVTHGSARPFARHDSDAASIFSTAAQKASSVLSHHRGTPHRSNSGREEQQPASPLLMSPSAQSISSLAGSGGKVPPNLYDSTQMKAAIEKFENAHKLDVKGGELGSVGAVGFGGDDSWQTVTVKVLPLWNNDPLNGYIEDLNELVHRHIKRIIDRSPSNAVSYLTEHFQELLATGMLTLAAKLSYLGDDQFLKKVDEVWVSFFNRILPYLEAIFLPFQTNADLKNLYLAFNRSTKAPRGPPISIRRLAMIAFRDQILLPCAHRLLSLFAYVARLEGDRPDRFNHSRRGSLASTVSSGHTPNASTYRHSLPPDAAFGDPSLRMQMLGLIASAQTDDDSQDAVETLMRASMGDIDIAELDERTASPSALSSDSDEDVDLVRSRRAGGVYDDSQ